MTPAAGGFFLRWPDSAPDEVAYRGNQGKADNYLLPQQIH
jgi:hypothetical protein